MFVDWWWFVTAVAAGVFVGVVFSLFGWSIRQFLKFIERG